MESEKILCEINFLITFGLLFSIHGGIGFLPPLDGDINITICDVDIETKSL